MFSRLSRISTTWVTVLVVLASFGVALAYNRIAATTNTPRSTDAQPVVVKKQRPMTALPNFKWKRGEPWPGKWIKYQPDEVNPHGISIEVTEGIVTGVAREEGDKTQYDILGTRYVIDDVDATDVTPALWRTLRLELEKPDGSIAKLSMARPLWWLAKTEAKTGATIDIGIQEIGISGMAHVLEVSAFTEDSRDNQPGSNLVIGKIEHQNAEVWDLVFNDNTAKPLGVTANHPIFSEDRNDWTPAGEIKINERVRTLEGKPGAVLTGKSKRPKLETVYNLEVHRSHVYHVGEEAILAHNGNIIDCTKTVVFRGKESAEMLRHARPTIDIKIDKATGLVIPGRSGLSVNLDQQKLLSVLNKDGTLRFPTAPRVKSIPDELQIIQHGGDLGHFLISPKNPITPSRFQELLNLVEFFD